MARWRIGLTVSVAAVAFATGALAVVAVLHLQADRPVTLASAVAGARQIPAAFAPPLESQMPDGPEGESIRRGREIFTQTSSRASAHVGNGLNCSNCHLNAGRQAHAAPMWAAWGAYPAYRTKNDRINTMEDRIRDCFTYSINAQASPSGSAPPPADPIYRDLQMYFFWLAKGAATGANLPGRGFIKLPTAKLGHDPQRGAQVYTASCAACHGAHGEGQRADDGRYAFPPLWGPQSYNWGAGMARIANAAGFIKANMPLGQGYSLSDQQAWDVAAYIDSRDRPRDPRQTGSIAEARARHHPSGDYYGQRIDGDLLGDGIAHATDR